MTTAGDRKPLPRAVNYVALAMTAVGVIAIAAGTIGVSDRATERALASMGVMVTGAVLLLVGWRLHRGERWAYVAALVVLGLMFTGWLVRAIVARESWFMGQLLGPALGLWALLRPESRAHYVR